MSTLARSLCGGGEIRTHDGLRHGGFQDRSFQPLTHASAQTPNNTTIFYLLFNDCHALRKSCLTSAQLLPAILKM